MTEISLLQVEQLKRQMDSRNKDEMKELAAKYKDKRELAQYVKKQSLVLIICCIFARVWLIFKILLLTDSGEKLTQNYA